MIDLCKVQGLPEPEFKEEFYGISVHFHKDVYTEKYLREFGFNERQIKAVMYVKEKGKITNKEYKELNGVIKKTASRDLGVLTDKHILGKVGSTGKGTYYIMK